MKNLPIGPGGPHPVVEVHMPSHVSVELVQGNDLRHYEIFGVLFSLCASIAAAFWTARFLSGPNGPILASAWAFTAMTAAFFVAAAIYRSRMYRGSIKKVASLDTFTAEELPKLLPPGHSTTK